MILSTFRVSITTQRKNAKDSIFHCSNSIYFPYLDDSHLEQKPYFVANFLHYYNVPNKISRISHYWAVKWEKLWKIVFMLIFTEVQNEQKIIVLLFFTFSGLTMRDMGIFAGDVIHYSTKNFPQNGCPPELIFLS